MGVRPSYFKVDIVGKRQSYRQAPTMENEGSARNCEFDVIKRLSSRAPN